MFQLFKIYELLLYTEMCIITCGCTYDILFRPTASTSRVQKQRFSVVLNNFGAYVYVQG